MDCASPRPRRPAARLALAGQPQSSGSESFQMAAHSAADDTTGIARRIHPGSITLLDVPVLFPKPASCVCIWLPCAGHGTFDNGLPGREGKPVEMSPDLIHLSTGIPNLPEPENQGKPLAFRE